MAENYEALIARIRYHIQKANFMGLKKHEGTLLLKEAADAIEELLAYCNNQEDTIKELVNELEKVERKHGKWTDISVYGIEDTSITDVQSAICSVCHKYHTTPYMYYFDSYNFCPNCGADMRESEGE